MKKVNCVLSGHEFINEIQTISQIFFPNERFKQLASPSDEGVTIVSGLNYICQDDRDIWQVSCYSAYYEDCVKLFEDRRVICLSQNARCDPQTRQELKHLVKLSMYSVLKQKTCITPPWGILTGIRPAKIAAELFRLKYSKTDAEKYISDRYLVINEKARLMTAVAQTERLVLENRPVLENAFSLYIGIPFCPSRCGYCSFTSYPISKYKSKIIDYIDSITLELKQVTDFFGKKAPESLYIGGGTPVAPETDMFELLLARVAEHIDIKSCGEFTVEAGRPDAISAEKLQKMKAYGVTRISINPQTLNDATLIRIGREHTAADFENKFSLARSMGFDNINTDLILGLPGETTADVCRTFQYISELKPDSATVHTLAIKRASGFNEELRSAGVPESAATALTAAPLSAAPLIEEMLKISAEYMELMGMRGYYMYRQKNSLGNFENVGYSKPGAECLYNIFTMSENQTIIALGAGGVTKMVDVTRNKIERVFNPKNVDEYMARINEILKRKLAGLTAYKGESE